jgi:hypothetical protein
MSELDDLNQQDKKHRPKTVWVPGFMGPKKIENEILSRSDIIFVLPALAGLQRTN